MTTTSSSVTSAGEAFAQALGTKDAAALRRILRPDVEFRALTPRKFWEADDAETVINDIVLGKWFEPSDDIREIVAIETSDVGPRHRVAYRLQVTNPDGDFIVEQQAYFDLDDDGQQISWLRVLCAGYTPIVA
jgi:hypothetical protein